MARTFPLQYAPPIQHARTKKLGSTLNPKALAHFNPPWLHRASHGYPEHPEQLIQLLCKQGQINHALDVLLKLQAPPSSYTYTCLLKACGKTRALTSTRKVHEHMARNNIELAASINDYLVVTLARCGDLETACYVFITLPERTVFSWSAIILAYVDLDQAQAALSMHEIMHGDGVQADNFTFSSLFKACGEMQDLKTGQKLHLEACKKGFDSDIVVSNTLVSMYGKCGAMSEVEHVFSNLYGCDIVTWNVMLSIYVEEGQAKKGLLLYRQMRNEGVKPDKYTLVSVLQALEISTGDRDLFALLGQKTSVTCLEIAQALVKDAQLNRLTLDVFVGTALLRVYGRCGSMLDAENAFCALSQCDIVSWNALMSMYIEQREGAKALQLYVHMQKECIMPNDVTLVHCFQACGVLAEKEEAVRVEGCPTKVVALKVGKALHADAGRKGRTFNGVLGNTLLIMYVKSGAITDAEDAFGTWPSWDIVSWNVILSAYVEQGHVGKSLMFFRQALEEGLSPDLCMFISAVQACGLFGETKGSTFLGGLSSEVAALEIGHTLHADIRKKPFASDTFLNTTFVSMYSKCGAYHKAEHVMSSMVQRDTVSWNAMLSAYLDGGCGEKVLQAYVQMFEEGVLPDQLTLMFSLQACGALVEKEGHVAHGRRLAKTICLEIGQALHENASELGYVSDSLVGTALLSMYGKCGDLVEAEDAFCALPHRDDCVPWNVMLSVLIDHGQLEKALDTYQNMQKQEVTVNDVTFIYLLQACSEMGSLVVCRHVHFSVVCTGYGRMSSVEATLIHAYGCCARVEDAKSVFADLPNPDVVSWTACLASYAFAGSSYTCFHVFESLKIEGSKPDEVMLASVLAACNHAGLVSEGFEYYVSMGEHDLSRQLKHRGIMIELHGRVGDFGRVKDCLKSMPIEADLTLWLSLLGACHTHGNLEVAKQAFGQALKLDHTNAASYILMSNIFTESRVLFEHVTG